jgi:hypothetical protein
MTKILLGVALAITFCTPLSAQRVENSLLAALAPAAGAPNAPNPRTDDAPTAFSATTFSIPRAEMEKTNRGRNMLYGGLIGAVAGAAAGTYIMYSADEYMAAPAHFVTVPVGAVLGVLVGAVVP